MGITALLTDKQEAQGALFPCLPALLGQVLAASAISNVYQWHNENKTAYLGGCNQILPTSSIKMNFNSTNIAKVILFSGVIASYFIPLQRLHRLKIPRSKHTYKTLPF